MKVRAKSFCYYGDIRRKEGAVFELVEVQGLDKEGKPRTWTPEQQFSDKYMEKIEEDAEPKAPRVYNESGEVTHKKSHHKKHKKDEPKEEKSSGDVDVI